MKKILFVCMGNICRSPSAEAIFRKLTTDAGRSKDWLVDSAGTHAYHVGSSPDKRSQQAAQKRGYNLAAIRARQVQEADFFAFDWILAMDRQNLALLQQAKPSQAKATLGLMLDFARQNQWKNEDVPDPYYGGTSGFDDVLDRLEDACAGFLAKQT